MEQVSANLTTTCSSVSSVVKANLCTGCGTCAGVCPSSAIAMHISEALLRPEVKNDKCTNCGLCLSCCPGHAVDMLKMNRDIYGNQPSDRVLGNFIRCFVGYSTNTKLRQQVSSGGIATELLIFALKKRFIDGALIIKMRKDDPLIPGAFIARTAEEVISGVQSKYCPAAPNVLLKTISSERGRFAVVGLPCQIHGLRKAEEVLKGLRGKIVLHVGIFCGHTVNFDGTELLMKKFHVNKEDVSSIEYRGRGQPGSMKIKLKNDKTFEMRFNRGWKAYWNVFSPFFFTPFRCFMCGDQFNDLADISLGDAWLPEFEKGEFGQSIVISRSSGVDRLLSEMVSEKRVILAPLTAEQAKRSQGFSVNFKKHGLSTRLSLLNMLGHDTPRFNPVPDGTNLLARFDAFCSYASFVVSRNKRLKSVLAYLPLPLFRVYFGLFKCSYLLSNRRGG